LDNPKRKFTPAGILGAVAGFAFSRYAGSNVLVPIVGAVLIGWTIKKIKREQYPMGSAVAVQGGHCLWMIVAAVVGVAGPSFLVETAIFAAAIAWLYFQPRLPAVILLGTYQAIALVVNLSAIKAVPLDSTDAKALSVHIALRVIGIGAMAWALRASAKAAAAVEPAVRP